MTAAKHLYQSQNEVEGCASCAHRSVVAGDTEHSTNPRRRGDGSLATWNVRMWLVLAHLVQVTSFDLGNQMSMRNRSQAVAERAHKRYWEEQTLDVAHDRVDHLKQSLQNSSSQW